MPTFVFRAKQGPDRTVDGEVRAENRADALARVEAMGGSPVWVREVGGGDRAHTRRGRARAGDVNVFTRQLASLLKAGVPILRALETIRRQSDSHAIQSVAADLLAAVRDGGMLSEGLATHPALFPELYRNMVRAGESGGVLDEVLLRLAEARENEEALRAKVQGALAYPCLVLGVGAFSVGLIMTLFLPRIVGLYAQTRAVLPLPTRFLIALSGFFASYAGWLALALLLAVFAARRAAAGEKGRRAAAALWLRIPLLGRFVRDADLIRFARMTALLVRSGIPVDRAVALSAGTMRNGVLRGAMEQVARETVMNGTTLGFGISRQAAIPAFVASMVAVGEESGQIEDTLGEVAGFYERELDRDIRIATTLLEPVLILVVGAVVGWIIFAMLLPVFSVSHGLG